MLDTHDNESPTATDEQIVQLEERVSELEAALRAVEPLVPLLRMLTIRQVFDEGSAAIDAAGLNPWCLNEGRATGSERALSEWKIEAILDPIRKPRLDTQD